jgi:glutamate N-acetyltransferase/amino-acid N-acetyltransferase
MSVVAAKGYRATGVWCGIKGSGKPDLTVVVSDRLAAAAGVFTPHLFRAAPVVISAARLAASGGRAAAIVATSGNANAMSGEPGRRDALEISRAAARKLGIADRHILLASTGAIGFRLPVPRVVRGVAKAARGLARTDDAGLLAARGILTTDTGPKQARARFTDGAAAYAVGGIAKGVGMVAPNMATVLVFLTTDAAIAPPVLRRELARATAGTFNEITVEGEMSTNDTAFLLANGAAATRPLSARGLAAFRGALHEVCDALARMLVKDGEGASRLFEVRVSGAATAAAARLAARAVADSPLVKTMIYGRQANWGRIGQALGACGVRFDPARIRVRVGGELAIRGGVVVPPRFTVLTRLAEDVVRIDVSLGAGPGRARVLAADLTEQYVKINAGYLS